MSGELNGRKIAILATDGFEQVELTEPKKNVEAAGAKTDVLSVKDGEIKGWKFTDWGDSVPVDKQVTQARVEDYDALILPGGQINPDKLRTHPEAVDFVRRFVESGKPVAAICHGPWMLIEAGTVRGKTMTSWPSVSTDLKNAGANWVDQQVVEDGQMITSRKPDDIPAFSQAIIRKVSSSSKQQAA